MHVRRVDIKGFRGVSNGRFLLTPCCAFIGPNGSGKSTLVDAIALALGRGRLVRTLTEHDFTGCNPERSTRFQIIVTLSGFPGNQPDRHSAWFREGRAIPKWIDKEGTIHGGECQGAELCAQIAVAGRFDFEDLAVETMRYFWDGEEGEVDDPFLAEEVVEQVPLPLVNEVGFFVLLSQRTWEGVVSFNSELFRRTVLEAAGFPATEVLDQRNSLRDPDQPVEQSKGLGALVAGMNDRLRRLMPGGASLRLRLTSCDSEGVLHALQPHYASGNVSLPVGRHGAGLLSLQSLLLLLEVAKARKEKGRATILALEEPEVHLAPGLSARLVAEARSIADQVICTTHSPRVAASFDATCLHVMSAEASGTVARPLLSERLDANARNIERKLFHQNRMRLVEAIMQPMVLVPEGRLDAEWLGRFSHAAEAEQTLAPFGSVFGIAPTEDAAVVATVATVHAVRSNVMALVDGDGPGDSYVEGLRNASPPPKLVVQWPSGKAIEDVVGWVLDADQSAFSAIQAELGSKWAFDDLPELVGLLKTANEPKAKSYGIKDDLVAHDVIAGVICRTDLCRKRCAQVLDALVAAATETDHPSLETPNGNPMLRRIRLS